MDKYTNDSNVLALQNAAYEAARKESLAADDFHGGAISEEMYVEAMNETERVVNIAIKAGVCRKDLPAI